MSMTFSTESLHPYSVQFSPHDSNLLAVCANENYGISGRGELFIFNLRSSSSNDSNFRNISRRFQYSKSIYDLTWSEDRNDLIFAAAIDGRVIGFDISRSKLFYDRSVHESAVISSIDYGRNGRLLTASWDKTLSVVDLNNDSTPIRRFTGHSGLVYEAIWSPRSSNNTVFVSCSSDRSLRIWDTRADRSPLPVLTIAAASSDEILTVDWCKYEDHLVASGDSKGDVRIWDLRRVGSRPLADLVGHEYAVRRVRWSPFARDRLISCSYDRTVRVWNAKLNISEQPTRTIRPMQTIRHHSEFVYGLDYSLHAPDLVADCAWDRTVKIYRTNSLISAL